MPTKLDDVHTEVRALIKSKGMRVTAQRLAVLVALHERRAPMTHEEVMLELGTEAYDKASVWRVLSDFAGIGLVRRMDLGDRVWRYELYDACRPLSDDHPHFLCEVCSEVTCLPPLEVRSRDGGFPAALVNANFHIRISGTCARCVGP